WIYPGNNVRFYGAEEQPAQVEVGGEVPDVDEGAMVDEEGVTVTGALLFQPKGTYRAFVPGFVTTKELDEAARVKGAFHEESYLVAPRTVYVDVSKRALRVGDQTVFFRDGGEVMHPVTGEFYGYLTRVLAEGKVLAVDSKLKIATVALTHSYAEVARGDSVGPAGESLLRVVSPRRGEREVKGGAIIKSVNSTTAMGESFFVIIDRGADDGVKLGNFFTISRSGDLGDVQRFFKPADNDPTLPAEVVGRCIAVDVKSRATTCLITNSLRELNLGDQAVVEFSSARTASR
ncbi:MAG: peptidoglycan-binding protein, partial [Myxococcaceae bacterium]|nr:peptidoglycan-binding protein [Myxococcaceae bacterium]